MTVAAAAATVMTGASPAMSGPPTSATSARTICVALVVDYAELGGGVRTTCAKVKQGSTGYDVLSAGGHTFVICSNGVLGEIDGQPSNGCQIKDDTHYWTYWHRAPGSSRWSYSNEGGGTYQPANTSTEGWRWRGGGALTPPSDVPYSHICASSPSPRPSPSPSRTPVPAPARTAQPGTRTTTAAAATAVTPHRSARPRVAARQHAPAQRGAPRRSPSITSATSTTGAGTPAPDATAVGNVGHGDTGTTNGAPVGLLAGVGAVVVIGGGAAWQARRRREDG